MGSFLKKVFAFFCIPLGLLWLYVSVTDYYYNETEYNENRILIWGDSQAFQGINLELFQTFSGKQAVSWAQHGGGVYDFLCFTERVPENSNVIVSLSIPVLLRKKNTDYNRSNISLKSLMHLAQNNYSISEIVSILKKNVLVRKLELYSTNLYSSSDSVLVSESVISILEDATSSVPDYLSDKQRLMLIGIRTLRDKGCTISFVEFPTHPIIQKIEQSSDVYPIIQQFKLNVCKEFQDAQIDTIVLDTSKEIMYDLTHLNELGAAQVSEKLGEKISRQRQATLYIIELD